MLRAQKAISRAQNLFPRAQNVGVRAIAEIARLLEPHAAGLVVEITGQIPRGDLLPDANPASLRVRAVASAFGVEPLRLFVDPGVREPRLCADGRLALAIQAGLATPAGLFVA